MGQSLLTHLERIGFVGDNADEETDSSGERENEQANAAINRWIRGPGRQRNLASREPKRLRAYLDLLARNPEIQELPNSFLELSSVEERSLRQSLAQLKVSNEWSATQGQAPCTDAEMDEQIVNWTECQFVKGENAWKSETLLAAILALEPTFGKAGRLKLTRACPTVIPA